MLDRTRWSDEPLVLSIALKYSKIERMTNGFVQGRGTSSHDALPLMFLFLIISNIAFALNIHIKGSDSFLKPKKAF